jgi:hypothetical protein
MLRARHGRLLDTRFVAENASNARANQAWTPSEGVSTAAAPTGAPCRLRRHRRSKRPDLILGERSAVPSMSVRVKVCGCRPHDGGAAHTGAGVRKPPREETAGGVARSCVRRYGDFDAGGLLPRCVECLFGRRTMKRGARSAGREMRNRSRAVVVERHDGYRG